MSDRRKRIESNLFANADKVSPQELDSSIFGGEGWFDSVVEDETITFIPIDKIEADLSQPRRALPSFLYRQWDGRAPYIATLYELWLHAISEERGIELTLRDYFEIASDERADESSPEPVNQSLESDFLAVIDLAVSIRRDGLTNPITVVRMGDVYRIETGERRWLAFHLLYLLYKEEDSERWHNIPARVVEEMNIWRQASENNVRADLNAIDKARQFALLLMNLLGERREAFASLQEIIEIGGSERDFYAQVSDGDQYRVPRGRAEQMLNAMGLKNIRQLSYYRNLLQLPDEAWQLADDYNLTERALRECLLVANGDTATITELIKDLIRKGTSDRNAKTPKSPRHLKPKTDENLLGYSNFSKNARSVQRYASKSGALKAREKREALEKIKAMRDWLSQIENQIRQK